MLRIKFYVYLQLKRRIMTQNDLKIQIRNFHK